MPRFSKKTKKNGKASALMKLQKQVATLTKRVGYPERYDTQHMGRASFGAFDSTTETSGHFCVNITPPTLHSVYDNVNGVGGRCGKAINLKSFQLRLRIASDVQRVNGGRVTVYMVRQPVNNIDLTAVGSTSAAIGIHNFLQPDPWLTDSQGYPCYTTQSLRQMENANFSKFRIIAKRTINFPMEAIGSITAIGVKNVDIFKKVNFPVEYEVNTSLEQDAIKNPIYLIAVCDGGNITGQTGFTIQHNIKYFYTDN
jgi:hypothetical protein